MLSPPRTLRCLQARGCRGGPGTSRALGEAAVPSCGHRSSGALLRPQKRWDTGPTPPKNPPRCSGGHGAGAGGCPEWQRVPPAPPTSEVFLEEAEAEALAVRSDDLGQGRRAAEEDLHLPLPLLGHLAKHLARGKEEKGKGSGSVPLLMPGIKRVPRASPRLAPVGAAGLRPGAQPRDGVLVLLGGQQVQGQLQPHGPHVALAQGGRQVEVQLQEPPCASQGNRGSGRCRAPREEGAVPVPPAHLPAPARPAPAPASPAG